MPLHIENCKWNQTLNIMIKTNLRVRSFRGVFRHLWQKECFSTQVNPNLKKKKTVFNRNKEMHMMAIKTDKENRTINLTNYDSEPFFYCVIFLFFYFLFIYFYLFIFYLFFN